MGSHLARARHVRLRPGWAGPRPPGASHPAYSEPVIELTAGDARYRDDRGAADPAVSAALAAYDAGDGSERAALAALAGSRLLVPVVAVPGREGEGPAAPPADGPPDSPGMTPAGPVPPARGGEKDSEMAMPALVGQDGRRALPAFTCLDAVRRWQPAARPVAVPASGVFQAAVQDGCAVIIDVAGPVPLAVEGARLAALAAGSPAPAMHEDPGVWRSAAAAAGRVAPGIRVRLSAPPEGAEFTLELAPPQGTAGSVPDDVVTVVVEAVRAALADRVRSAIAVARRSG